jgi:hypothetical protein
MRAIGILRISADVDLFDVRRQKLRSGQVAERTLRNAR